MVTTLSKLVEMMELGTIPAWIRQEIATRRDEISKSLRETGSYVLNGPNGERVEIEAPKAKVAA